MEECSVLRGISQSTGADGGFLEAIPLGVRATGEESVEVFRLYCAPLVGPTGEPLLMDFLMGDLGTG